MISEVPLGAFLSGGVDSSAVVAMMAGVSADPVNTCSIAFADPKFDESAFAQQVADRYHTRHFVDRVESEDFDLIDTLAALYDEPYADSSAIPTYRVCQLARKHVTVALSGDGGDESFGGYRRYRLHLMEERMRSLLPLSDCAGRCSVLLGRVYPKLDWAPRAFRGKTTFEGMARTLGRGLLSLGVDPARADAQAAVQRETPHGVGWLRCVRRVRAPRKTSRYRRRAVVDPVPGPQDLSRRRHQHQGRPCQHGALAGSARTVDGPSADRMARDVAGRHEGARQRGQVPAQEGDGAAPAATRSCTGRRWASRCHWLVGSVGRSKARVRESILGPRLRGTGWFNEAYLQHLVDAHQSGRSDYSAPLWTLLMFDAFLGSVMGEGATTGPARDFQ